MTQSQFGIGTARLLGAGMVLALLVSILPMASVFAAITPGLIAGSPVLHLGRHQLRDWNRRPARRH